MKIIKNGAQFYRKIITEEHIALIEEPGSKYIGHLITPQTGSAKDVKCAIMSFLRAR